MNTDHNKQAPAADTGSPVKLWLLSILFLAFTTGFIWSVSSGPTSPISTPNPAQSSAAGLVRPAALKPEPASTDIKKIVPGMRVKAFNPEVSDEERAAWEEVDYTRWLELNILLMDEQNEPIYLTLIRPVEWVIAMDAREGRQIWLELEELNGRGWGRVMSLSRCRKVLPGEGRVVTGIFSHKVRDLIDVHVQGLKEPIGVTSNHPFWSEDRQEFVQAGSLQAGERLRAMVGGPDGGIARVTAISPRGPPGSSEIVYNMEVEGEHAYQVTGLGLVVHNSYEALYDQYALVAKVDGFYPVLQRGVKGNVGGVFLKAGDVWKYGITKNPSTRYSQAFLAKYNLGYDVLSQGTRIQVRTFETLNIWSHIKKYAKLPPGNKIVG